MRGSESTTTRKAGDLSSDRRLVADKGKSTSVLLTLNLHPGAKHPG